LISWYFTLGIAFACAAVDHYKGVTMSLEINTEKVEAVLLPDGKWYAVAEHSFALGPFEFMKDAVAIGKEQTAGVPIGASWKDNMGKRFVCPVSAMLAVRYS
jgi:hypothetical protein